MSDNTKKLLKKPFTQTILAIVLGLIAAGIILGFTGYPPIKALTELIYGIFGKPKYIVNVIVKSTPIILTGLGVAFAFKTGLFNIGAEGQFIVGTIAAVAVGVVVDLPAVLEIPLIIIAGMAAGALYAGIVGFLKAKFGIHEVITSIMLNWIALYLNNYVVKIEALYNSSTNGSKAILPQGYTKILGVWKRSDEGIAAVENNPFLRDILLKTDINVGIFIAIAAAVIISFLLYKTKKGFELRAVGFNMYAAESAGINVKRNIIQAMLISGALCGLGAAMYITGQTPHAIAQLATFENVGFNGLSVALIAGSSPIGCIFAGILFSSLIYGGEWLQFSSVHAPSEIINIVIGIIVFFVALTKIIPELVDRFGKKGGKK